VGSTSLEEVLRLFVFCGASPHRVHMRLLMLFTHTCCLRRCWLSVWLHLC